MKIRFSLSPRELDRAIRQVEEYQNWVREKTALLNERLAVYGAHVAAARFSSAWYDGLRPDVSIDVRPTQKGWVISASGEDVLFVEFGAGVYYNGPEPYPQPRPPEVAKIGEYGKGHGKRPSWGYYGEDGELHITHGTPAAMPMWWAAREIQQDLARLAREVFGT